MSALDKDVAQFVTSNDKTNIGFVLVSYLETQEGLELKVFVLLKPIVTWKIVFISITSYWLLLKK